MDPIIIQAMIQSAILLAAIMGLTYLMFTIQGVHMGWGSTTIQDPDFQNGLQAGEKDGKNAVGDIGDTCNNAKNQTACYEGYRVGYNVECAIGQKLYPSADIQCPYKPFVGSVNPHTFKAPPSIHLTQPTA